MCVCVWVCVSARVATVPVPATLYAIISRKMQHTIISFGHIDRQLDREEERQADRLAVRDTVRQTERKGERERDNQRRAVWHLPSKRTIYRQLPRQTSICYENALKLRVFCLKTWPSRSGLSRQTGGKTGKAGRTGRAGKTGSPAQSGLPWHASHCRISISLSWGLVLA